MKKRIPANLFAYKGKLGKDAHEVKLALSDGDRRLYGTVAKEPYDDGPLSVVVTDLNTKVKWRLKKADCGAGCKCACEANKVDSPDEEFALAGPRWALDAVNTASRTFTPSLQKAWNAIRIIAQEE